MGVRPLFYTQANKAFIFASEIKAIFAVPGVTREIDVHGLDEVFTYWCTIPPTTLFRNVHELPPGQLYDRGCRRHCGTAILGGLEATLSLITSECQRASLDLRFSTAWGMRQAIDAAVRGDGHYLIPTDEGRGNLSKESYESMDRPKDLHMIHHACADAG